MNVDTSTEMLTPVSPRQQVPDKMHNDPLHPNMNAQAAQGTTTRSTDAQTATAHTPDTQSSQTSDERKSPQPFAFEDSTDVIALRAVLSSLQMQKARAETDIRTLRDIKTQALAYPDEFQKHVIESAALQTQSTDFDPSLDTAVAHEKDNTQTDTDTSMIDSAVSFPAIPTPQDIVRCPPINWDKYHIVGEPLDRLHREQQAWPGSDHENLPRQPRRQESVIAAPYDALYDEQSQSDGSKTVENASKGKGNEARKDSAVTRAPYTVLTRRSSKIADV